MVCLLNNSSRFSSRVCDLLTNEFLCLFVLRFDLQFD